MSFTKPRPSSAKRFVSRSVIFSGERQGTVRLWLSQETYTNSTHVLTRTRLSKVENAGVLSVLASYDGDAKEVGFTVTVFSSEDVGIKWNETVVVPPYTTKVCFPHS